MQVNSNTIYLWIRMNISGENISDVEDHLLITVLRSCKYSIKKSEKKLIKYLQTQDMFTKWLQTADLKRVENAMSHLFIGLLPYRDKHGRVIIFTTSYCKFSLPYYCYPFCCFSCWIIWKSWFVLQISGSGKRMSPH